MQTEKRTEQAAQAPLSPAVFTIIDLEKSINRCVSDAHKHGFCLPPDYRLSPDAGVLADVYGAMIYNKEEQRHISSLSAKQLNIYTRFFIQE